ncbi:uncharacterized protein BBA_09029 [Beauveria bassiana ARSEF 2860]|uniref:Uncharacterized protein n=1 Tax=Beauveria bassiana (strain ARSEF 2860) TaxID=655819 RepID=J5JE05_BEAB2|nr:uncharacterized protein BBA_09029 [Beauveria bassiana ARSEF 2860]EJP61981.1 hypothetical protein BBA_09029 [Beauveria bassiana ARSEF 2860]
MTAAAAHEGDIVPTTCSETIEHEDGPRAPTPSSPCLLQGTACGAAGEDQDEVIFIPSDSESESESDSEADEDVPSFKATNALIDKETTVQLHSTSPASTMTTVPNTPRAVASGLEVDNDLNGAVQHSISPVSLTTVSRRQEPRDGLNSSRCPPSLSAAEVAEQDQGQVEDANESVSSHCGHHEADDRAELPRQIQPHESASQNVLACNDADGHTTDVGGCDSSRDADSDNSSDSSGGSDGNGDGDDDDDDRSSRDTDEEDGGHSKNRGTARSPSVNNSDNGHADDPPDDNTEEPSPRPHKRQKVTHDRKEPARHQNSLPRSAGRASRSPGRPQTASMLSPPASHSLSESESDEVSDCSKASAASFGEWLLKNAALKCVTIDGVTTYQLQFQRAQAHSSSRRRETRPQGLAKSNKGGGRKPRDETKGRLCDRSHFLRVCRRFLNLLIYDYHRYDKYGRTLLITAAALGHVKSVTDLLLAGIDTGHKDYSDKTVLLCAAGAGVSA